MAEGERLPERVAGPPCRWRTSAETLDLIEALERIEALLIRLDERVREGSDAKRTPDHRTNR